MSKAYVGEVGKNIDLDAGAGVDLTGYTLAMEFQKPDGTAMEKVAALKPATTNVVRYTTVAGDLDMAGTWKVQIKATSAAALWFGETAQFSVYAKFA
ncbi:MAG: hypothetical protein AB1513_11370 [Pseudomonadota bacterium]